MTVEHPLLKKIPVVEMFGPTIQGEGAVIGQQTYFIRFGLCDYRCKMCDSMHAVEPEKVLKNAEWLVQSDIGIKFMKLALPSTPNISADWVTFSGGNPCIHNLSHLVMMLKFADFKIAVETQGTIYQPWLNECDVVTVSPKGPGMGEKCDIPALEAFMALMDRSKINVKIVIFGRDDIEFAQRLFQRLKTQCGLKLEHFYLSQGNPYPPGLSITLNTLSDLSNNHVDLLINNYLELFDMIKNNPLLSKVKFLPQFHVWLWGNKQGV